MRRGFGVGWEKGFAGCGKLGLREMGSMSPNGARMRQAKQRILSGKCQRERTQESRNSSYSLPDSHRPLSPLLFVLCCMYIVCLSNASLAYHNRQRKNTSTTNQNPLRGECLLHICPLALFHHPPFNSRFHPPQSLHLTCC